MNHIKNLTRKEGELEESLHSLSYRQNRTGLRSLCKMVMLSSFLAKGKEGCESPPPQNQAPQTSINADFDWVAGVMNYTLSGTDSDGSVARIEYSFNNSPVENLQNNDVIEENLNYGQNEAKATAVDNLNKKDSTPAIHQCSVPYQNDMMNNLVNYLQTNYTNFEEIISPSSVYLEDEQKEIPVDALIYKQGGGFAVINYLGENDNLEEIVGNMQLLADYGVPILSLSPMPYNDAHEALKAFADSDYAYDWMD